MAWKVRSTITFKPSSLQALFWVWHSNPRETDLLEVSFQQHSVYSPSSQTLLNLSWKSWRSYVLLQGPHSLVPRLYPPLERKAVWWLELPLQARFGSVQSDWRISANVTLLWTSPLPFARTQSLAMEIPCTACSCFLQVKSHHTLGSSREVLQFLVNHGGIPTSALASQAQSTFVNHASSG